METLDNNKGAISTCNSKMNKQYNGKQTLDQNTNDRRENTGMNWGFPEMKVNERLMFGKYRVSFYVKDTWQQLLIQIEC